jgi:hypothetical protein
MAFQGHGTQAAAEQGSGGARGEAPTNFSYFERLSGEKRGYLNPLYIAKNVKDREIILLDDISSQQSPQFAALVHQFAYNSRFDNIVTSLEGVDERGCPFSNARRERDMKTKKVRPRLASAVWLLTGIEVNPFTYEKGPNAGKTVTGRRVLVCVPRGRTPNSKVSRVEEFMNFATKLKGGTRLRSFQVSRSGGDMSSKIGDTWWPLQDVVPIAEMRKRFAADADLYGYTIDQYLAPADYMSVCKPMKFEVAQRLAKFVEDFRRDNPSQYDRFPDEGPAAAPVHGDAYEAPPADEGSTIPF